MVRDNQLYERTDPRFKHLIGKKVKFVHKGEVCIGTLDFAGINEMLHGQFQVTASRTPHWPVDPSTIEEYVDDRVRVGK